MKWIIDKDKLTGEINHLYKHAWITREAQETLLSALSHAVEATALSSWCPHCEEKPPANADLVEELEALCEKYSKREDDKCWTMLVKQAVRKYRPVPVVKEKGEAGYIEEMAKTLEYLDACGGLGMDKHEMIRKALYRFQHHRKILTDNGDSVSSTPAPVASGLVEYLEHEIDLLKNGQSLVGPFQEGMAYAYENILSRYSKEER